MVVRAADEISGLMVHPPAGPGIAMVGHHDDQNDNFGVF